MTKAELVKALEDVPDHAEIRVHDAYEGDWIPVTVVKESRIYYDQSVWYLA